MRPIYSMIMNDLKTLNITYYIHFYLVAFFVILFIC
jgi:hypothetical protein